MSDMRVSDPSKLHLKKELTQIRKASRVLRDPGTTSSWRSPLASSSRSIAPLAKTSASSCSAWKHSNSEDQNGKGFQANSRLDPLRHRYNEKEKKKRVFLYNWKNPKSSSEKSDMAKNEDFDEDEEEEDDGRDDAIDGSSSYAPGSIDDSLSDGLNGRDVDSKSDTYLGDSHGRMKFKRRDANLVPLGTPTAFKKRSTKIDTHLDVLSKYGQKDIYFARKLAKSRRLLEGHSSVASEMSQDDSVEQSDDTEDYCQSEDVRRVTGTSPLLLKLKHKKWPRSPSKFLRSSRREDSSYSYSTPALSTSSYNGYRKRNPSTVGSWDGTTTSMNDVDDEVDSRLNLPRGQGCGIPSYWSKRTPRHRGRCGSCYSPSLSDTLKRKGSSLFCGSQNMYARPRRSSMSSNKLRISSKSSHGVLPLLANSGNGREGSSIETRRSDDDISTNFGELNLEALSRLDGRRWSSSCRSQEGLEIVAQNGEGEEGTPENINSFSQKYKPMFFGDLIGQNIVVQSLINSMTRGRIAPVYLFQGPRGTGKSSAARIFASALNCLAPDESKPCGYCRECRDFISGKIMDLFEVDGTNKKGVDEVRHLLKNFLARTSPASSRFKVFVIDECHLLPSKTWLAFLKFIEDPPLRVVFIFVTTDIDNVPRTIQSRCQKYIFNKIKDADIVARLRKISAKECLDVESDALNLIALNADGSLRDAETMLEQLSLLGKKISVSLVNELVGIVSDEKLLELLEFVMSSNTAETVKRARELMDAGVDPMILMSQLASLIMDIISGTYKVIDKKRDSLFDGRNLTEAEIKRLKHALRLLSEAEKQLRISNERSTWFTATLLQLSSLPSPDLSHSGSSRRQSWKTEDDPSSTSREVNAKFLPHNSISPAMKKVRSGNLHGQGDLLSQSDGFSSNSKLSQSQFQDGDVSTTSHDNPTNGNMVLKRVDLEKLDNIWMQCIDKCHSKTLQQLLRSHGKLVSISEVEGLLIAYIAFSDGTIKSRAERFLSSITNSTEIVLRCNVEVRIIHLPGGEASLNVVGSKLPKDLKQTDAINGYSNCYQLMDGTYQHISGSSALLNEGNTETSDKSEKKEEIPMQRIESIIREQRLETAWLQTVEKGTPGSLSCLKPEKNQVLPQDGTYCDDQTDIVNSSGLSSRQWEDELKHELKCLKTNDGKVIQKNQISKRIDRCPLSPSLLHDTSFLGNSGKANQGYESGSNTGGCSGFFCWSSTKHQRRGKVKGTPVRPGKGGQFSLFGECGKSKKMECRFRR